jgi:hypothetical protein
MFEILIMTDQPVICPYCGSRAEISAEFLSDDIKTQLFKCPNEKYRDFFLE